MNALKTIGGLIATGITLFAVATPQAQANPLKVELGMRSGRPTALATGQVLGATAALTSADEGLLWGLRFGWASAAESTLTWAVSHHELRLAGVLGWGHRDGAGLVHVAFGLGTTLVLESRERHQSARLTGDQALETDGLLLAPLALAEVGIALDVYERWQLALRGGPELHLLPATDDQDSGVSLRLGWGVFGGLGRRF